MRLELKNRESCRFTSKELDEETGLYYYGARYYEPTSSRWMNADPAGFGLVNPMGSDGEPRADYSVIESLNWYSYVSNNPVKYVDPTGMEEKDPATPFLLQKSESGYYPEACMAFAVVDAFIMAGYTPLENNMETLLDTVNDMVGAKYVDIIETVFGTEDIEDIKVVELPEKISAQKLADLVGDKPVLLKYRQSDFWGNKKLTGDHGIAYQGGNMVDPMTDRRGTKFEDVRGSKSTADFNKNKGGLYFIVTRREDE